MEGLTIGEVSKRTGIVTLVDIRVLLCDFAPDQPPPTRWRAIAEAKLPVIDEMIRRAQGMKHLLEAGLRCECQEIEECFLDGCKPGPEPAQARAGTALPIVTLPPTR